MRRLFPEVAELDDDGLADAYRVPPGRSVRVNFIASLDGAVSVDGRSGGLGSPGDRQVFQVLRALTDVVLVGHGTAWTCLVSALRGAPPDLDAWESLAMPDLIECVVPRHPGDMLAP